MKAPTPIIAWKGKSVHPRSGRTCTVEICLDQNDCVHVFRSGPDGSDETRTKVIKEADRLAILEQGWRDIATILRDRAVLRQKRN